MILDFACILLSQTNTQISNQWGGMTNTLQPLLQLAAIANTLQKALERAWDICNGQILS